MKFKIKRKYKIRKYRKCPFEIYEPEKKLKISKEKTFPFIIKIGNELFFLGGMTSFFVASFFIGVKNFFKFKKKVQDLDLRSKRVIEFKVRK